MLTMPPTHWSVEFATNTCIPNFPPIFSYLPHLNTTLVEISDIFAHARTLACLPACLPVRRHSENLLWNLGFINEISHLIASRNVKILLWKCCRQCCRGCCCRRRHLSRSYVCMHVWICEITFCNYKLYITFEWICDLGIRALSCSRSFVKRQSQRQRRRRRQFDLTHKHMPTPCALIMPILARRK